MKTLRLPATMESLEPFRRFVLESLQRSNPVEEVVFKIELVLEEALTNVVHYAYPEAEGDVEVGCALEDHKRFCLRVRDWGLPFNPLERPDPEMGDEIAERKVGGLGIYLIRHLVDELHYQWHDGGNLMTFRFHLAGGENKASRH